ncbi:Undecaprenyl diphosphate synthase [hydrothermal vent metagenome]|uniref:Undecaprenyl diphosphate synthase n=1 Tax=hydrothermal vent metagenome TaxID=652676 RepID=A0A3B0W4Z2_9ZZZZ
MTKALDNSPKALPQHIAVVMDGNGRWAKKRHLPRAAGHKSGVNATRKIVENCAKNKIEALTIFAFSSENWNRPEDEVSNLMSLFVSTIMAEVKKLNKKNVCVKFIGERTRFSEKLQKSINDAEELTKNNTGLQLNIAANYGGRWDVVNACKRIAESVKNNQEQIEKIDEKMFDSFMSLHEVPAPDLFIRTGGEQRISNFLIWQLAYSELYFVDTLWPDFSDEDFSLALDWYTGRQRRFGKTGQQLLNASA